MRNYRAILAMVGLASGAAWASTDCTSNVALITVETGNDRAGYIVSLESGVSFAMAPKARNYTEILSLVTRSQLTGEQLTARFAANGVDCKQGARRTDLAAILYAGERTQTVTTTQPATTPATTITTQPPARP